MGLDMYAYSCAKNQIDQNVDDPGAIMANSNQANEIAYWRKFNGLHGWMEDLYRSRGGNDTFNCVKLQLFPEDIDELEMALENNALTPREGFFFGIQEIYPGDVELAQKFIAKARECFEDDQVVFYDSWW